MRSKLLSEKRYAPSSLAGEAWVHDIEVGAIKRGGGVGEVGCDNGINGLDSGSRSMS